MFKLNLQQQSISGSSNAAAVDSELIRYNVFQLGNEDDTMQTKLLLKLTDECTAAIKNAIKFKSKLKMRIVDGMAIIEIDDTDGNVLRFKCSLQNQPATDVIFYERKKKMYKNIGLTGTVKLQVQATDKTFAEMKEKTQKLVEAEQQKKAKDMPKMQRGMKLQQNSHQNMKRGPTTANILSRISSNALKRNQSPLPTNMSLIKKQKQDTEIPKLKTKINMAENLVMLKKIEEEKKIASFKGTPAANTVGNFPKEEPMTTKKDLFYVPKRKNVHRIQSLSPASTATSTPKTISPPLAMAHPPSVDSTQLQHSSSCSPEDATAAVNQQQDQIRLGSLMLHIKPSRDWKQEFGKIGNKEEAARYFDCFKMEYSEYHQYYEAMEQVAGDFRKLQMELKNANNEAERLTVEEEIRKKFAIYQADQEFLRKREKHYDLRMKLDVIKQALYEWSKQQQ